MGPLDVNGLVTIHRNRFMLVHRLSAVLLDRHRLICTNGLGTIRTYGHTLVVLDVRIHVFFGLHEYLFGPLLVFKTDFVEVARVAPLGAA